MKHCRTVASVIASVAVAVALLPLAVAAADSTAVSIEAPAEVMEGSTFIARVAVDQVEDFDSCGFDVVYDQTIITVTDVTGGEIDGHSVQVGPGFWSYVPPGLDGGRTRVIAFYPGVPGPGVEGTGYVAEIHFEVLGSAGETAAITLENVAMYDYQADVIDTATEGHSVRVSVPTEPTISFGPRSFVFSASVGGANPATQRLEIRNSGPGTLEWSVSSDAPWLSLSPASGSSSGEVNSVTLSVTTAGMSAGNYTATITITAPGAINSPRTAKVDLEISATAVPPTNGNGQPAGRPPLVVLWIALGAVVVVGAIMLVLRRRNA